MEPSSGGKRLFRIAAGLVVVFGLLGAAVFVHSAFNAPEAVQPGQSTPPPAVTALAPSPQPEPEVPAAGEDAALEEEEVAEEPQREMRVPAFDVVRVDADGEGLVAGLAEPGAEVSVLVDGEKLAAAPADGAGRFAVFLTLAPSTETRVMSLLARLDGAEMRSNSTVIINPSEVPEPAGEETQVAVAPPSEPEEEEAVVAADLPSEEAASGPSSEEAEEDETALRAETEKAPEDEPVVAEASPAAPAPSPPNLSEETSPAAPEIAGATSPEPSTGETGTDGDTVAVASPVPSAIPEEEQAEEDTADLADQAAEEEAAPAGDTRSNTALAADDPAESSSAPERLAAVDTEPAEGSVDEAESNESAEASAPQLLLADEDGITVLQSPEAMSNVALDTISYDEQGDVSLGGRALGTGFVRVYLDDRPITTSRIEANGTWRTSLPNVASGVYTLRVDEVGEDGEVTSRIETPFRREDPEVVAELSASTPETTDDVAAPLHQDVFTVQPGSTLWAIARANYGEGQLYVKVFEANRDRIRDPDLIYPGQVFDIPE